MSASNYGVDSQVSASGELDTLAIEKFNNKVREQYLKIENIFGIFDLEEVQGTNTVSNKYIGETDVQNLGQGEDPKGGEVEFDKNRLVIDESLIARNIVRHLADVQDDINTKGRLATNQMKQLKKVEDRMVVQQAVAGAIRNKEQEGAVTAAYSRNKPRVKGHSFSHDFVLTAAAAEDPWILLSAIELILERKQEDELEEDEMMVMMPWKQFNAIRDIERIVNKDYSTFAGETRSGFVLKSFNVPVMATNRFPKVGNDLRKEGTHHFLSNENNGFRYDVTDKQAQAIVLVLGREGLLVGRSIALQTEIWRHKGNKSWYIDSWLAEGAIPDRWEHLGVIRAVSAVDPDSDINITADATARKARKAALTTSTS